MFWTFDNTEFQILILRIEKMWKWKNFIIIIDVAHYVRTYFWVIILHLTLTFIWLKLIFDRFEGISCLIPVMLKMEFTSWIRTYQILVNNVIFDHFGIKHISEVRRKKLIMLEPTFIFGIRKKIEDSLVRSKKLIWCTSCSRGLFKYCWIGGKKEWCTMYILNLKISIEKVSSPYQFHKHHKTIGSIWKSEETIPRFLIFSCTRRIHVESKP